MSVFIVIVLPFHWVYPVDASMENIVYSPGFCFHFLPLQAWQSEVGGCPHLRCGRPVFHTFFILPVCSCDNLLTSPHIALIFTSSPRGFWHFSPDVLFVFFPTSSSKVFHSSRADRYSGHLHCSSPQLLAPFYLWLGGREYTGFLKKKKLCVRVTLVWLCQVSRLVKWVYGIEMLVPVKGILNASAY